MKQIIENFVLYSGVVLVLIAPLYADSANKLTFKVTGLSGYTAILVGENGEAESAEITGSSVEVPLPDTTSRLYFRDTEGTIAKQGVVWVCKRSSKIQDEVCGKIKNKVNSVFKTSKSLNLGSGKVVGGAVLFKLRGAKRKSAVTTETVDAVNYATTGISTKGIPSSAGIRRIKVLDEDADADDDGLTKEFDADDDDDGILDNYDDSTEGGGEQEGGLSFRVFSNLKLDIDRSLNLHSTGLSTEKTDTALQEVQTLAIQVAGDTGSTTELDCGGLAYCSSGGTGITSEGSLPFPGDLGGANDTDSDGHGTITRGSTGDFQLRTGASSSTIAGGDTFIERVTDSSNNETEVPGMLNFVFHSTPAVKSVTIAGTTTTINYSVVPFAGSRQNCISAPASGDVTLEITGWRPQRPNEDGTFVDIGNSLITIDIPNGACSSPGGSCEAQGPGNCSSSSYTTSDANLSVGANGVEDGKSDVDADSSNTYTFSVNLSTCLNNASGGAVTWTAGQTLFIDLQFRSQYGDNAAQKFCVSRASS